MKLRRARAPDVKRAKFESAKTIISAMPTMV